MVSTTAAGDVRLRGILTVLLCGIAMGGAIDLWMDRPNNPGLFHVAFETAVFSLALGGVAYGDGAAEQEVASGWREPLALRKRR